MVKAITNGIEVVVKTNFIEQYSKPFSKFNLFQYKISIQNSSEYTVQLLSRHWYIFDSNHPTSEVIGDGVVGAQPELSPGSKYEYESFCNLLSDMGKMLGTYSFERKVDKHRFEVVIPEFQLMVPFRMN